MKDINFFKPYIDKKDLKFDRRIIYITLSTLGILTIIAYTVHNAIIIKQEYEKVERLRKVVENSKTIDKVESIKIKETELNVLRNTIEKIRELNSFIEKKDFIEESLLDMITSKVPKDLFLNSISIQDGDIHLVGISKDKWSIADFQRGLGDLKDIEENFVTNISLVESHYNFNINITLKGVNIDGEVSAEKGEN